MPMRLNPFIIFDGNTADAMRFYADILDGELKLEPFRQFGMDRDGIYNATLETPTGFHLYGCDAAPEYGLKREPGTNVQISLDGDDMALIGYWEGLSVGGEILTPFAPAIWGDRYGVVRDKFGIIWQVNVSGIEE